MPWLLLDPVVNNVPYTLTRLRLDGVVATEPDALWLHAEDSSGAVVGAALRTPPRELLIAAVSTAAAERLADWFIEDMPPLPGVSGPAEPAEAFSRRYLARSGATGQITRSSRIYRLDAVIPPEGVSGALRAATPDDLDLMLTWRHGFAVETGETDRGVARNADPAMRADTANRIGAGLVWLWEDLALSGDTALSDGKAQPVTTAWLSPPAAGIPRVSMVYTPPEIRGRGYASACVAAVSQLALDGGATATMLYADLANPLTNRIYQRIGYRAVSDTTQWRF